MDSFSIDAPVLASNWKINNFYDKLILKRANLSTLVLLFDIAYSIA